MSKDRLIIEQLSTKAALKQDVADLSEEVLAKLKSAAFEKVNRLQGHIQDKRVRLRLEDKGQHEFVLFVGSDVLIFQLHTNVFRFPDEHPFWKKKYLRESPEKGYFGVINIYNFLAESVERNRVNDEGYLIGRIFVNRFSHFVIEGLETLNAIAKDLTRSSLTDEKIEKIIDESILAAIDFDLLVPPYELIERSSVVQIQAISSELQSGTGKRLGFRFQNEDKGIV